MPGQYCENHDDGVTQCVVSCADCGQKLCLECDRVLHMPKSKQKHSRTHLQQEDASIQVELHEGCGRAKFQQVMALVDRNNLKAIVEFRSTSSAAACRFCSAPLGESGGVAQLVAYGVQNCCDKEDCAELAKLVCQKTLPCGHGCNGIRDEATCLPCLHGCDNGEKEKSLPLKQDSEDQCMVCFTSSLSEEPCIQVGCVCICIYIIYTYIFFVCVCVCKWCADGVQVV